MKGSNAFHRWGRVKAFGGTGLPDMGGTRGTLWQSNMTCWNIPYLVRRFFPFKALFTGDFPKTFTQTSISFSDFPAVLEDFIGPGIGT